MATNNVTGLEEFELIHWISQQAASGKHLSVGIGDDCAIQPQQAGQDLLTSTDLLIEGIHFNRDWTSMFDLGRKSAAVNISDIAAMGGRAQSLFLGVGRPKSVSSEKIKEFVAGFLDEIERYGAVLAGGDTCSSLGPLLISVTVQGVIATGKAICRRDASCGDAVYVSGFLGDSALALNLLQSGQQPVSYLAERFHTPTPRVSLGQKLSEHQLATAMLDVSDGLLADLGHILKASKVGADLELAKVPLSESFRKVLAGSPKLIELALAGGEDYELVFTSSRQDLVEQLGPLHPITRIGIVSCKAGLRIHQTDGGLYQCQRSGFDHFV